MFQASNANGSWAITRPMCTAVATTYAANRTRQTLATPSRTTGEGVGATRRGGIERAVGVFARNAHAPATHRAWLCNDPVGFGRSARAMHYLTPEPRSFP